MSRPRARARNSDEGYGCAGCEVCETSSRFISSSPSSALLSNTCHPFADVDGSSGLTKSKALDQREDALAKKEEDSAAAKKELEDHKKALQDREAELKKQEEESASGKKASEDREAALSKQERDNNTRFDDREAAQVQNNCESRRTQALLSTIYEVV
jgi:septal ring factor EnvC (AmiA/AmiB activator)